MKKDKCTWDLTPLYKSDNDPQIEKDLKISISKCKQFINKWKDRKDYLEDPKILRIALDEYNELDEKYGIATKPEYYLFLRNSQDKTDKAIITKMKRLEQEGIKILNEIQFFNMRISKISKEKQSLMLRSKELLPYKHYLEDSFNSAKYLLTEKEEKILNLTSSTSYSNWIDMTEEFLSKETVEILTEENKKKEIPFAENKKYLQSKNKKIRNIAAKEEYRVLEKWSDVAEHEINSILEHKRVLDELKGFERPDSSRHLSDDISTKTVDSMLDTVVDNFSLPQKYYKLKANLFGKKKLDYFERYVPYGNTDKKYTYEEAMKINREVFKNLDKEFLEILEDLHTNNRYDVFSYKGKRAGAFYTSISRILPSYILLNFKDNLDSVTEIAHETGHAINNYLMFKHQLSLNCSVPTSVAEVSSTFFEDFVLQRLTKDIDKETQLSLLMKKLDDDIGSIHRQTACYKFEQELHDTFRKESYLPKEKISKIFKKHMSAYMGNYISQDKGSEFFWVAWSHIRMFFYVYSYSSGLLISKALQNMVKENPKNIDKVKIMLSTGTSKSPEEMFKDIGIDITKKEFWGKGLKEVENTYQEAYKLAKELKKI